MQSLPIQFFLASTVGPARDSASFSYWRLAFIFLQLMQASTSEDNSVASLLYLWRVPSPPPFHQQSQDTAVVNPSNMPAAVGAVPGLPALPAPAFDGSFQGVRFIRQGLPAHIEQELVDTAPQGLKIIREADRR